MVIPDCHLITVWQSPSEIVQRAWEIQLDCFLIVTNVSLILDNCYVAVDLQIDKIFLNMYR